MVCLAQGTPINYLSVGPSLYDLGDSSAVDDRRGRLWEQSLVVETRNVDMVRIVITLGMTVEKYGAGRG